MNLTKPLLIEIGAEELPAKAIKLLGESFLVLICKGLKDRNFSFGRSHWYGGPRRLAALIQDVDESTSEQQVEILGPSVKAARDQNGAWNKAAEGFAKKHGTTVDRLKEKQTEKGARLLFISTAQGAALKDVLKDIIAESIDALPIEKRMRWGANRVSFVRPVHWVIVMHGSKVFTDPVLGLVPGNISYGHATHSVKPIKISDPLEYEAALENAYVIADFKKRKSAIERQIHAKAESLDATAVVDEDLLGEVAGLCEWPVALSGNFNSKFLALPTEALILAMKIHQKYFPVFDSNGDLLPHFITICNIESKDPKEVIKGNERVVGPRLSDAAFFFEADKLKSLESRQSDLEKIIFQQKLGSLQDKTRRIQRAAKYIAHELGVNEQEVDRAAFLCKADLTSQMVLELPDMQGIAGRHYAKHDGEDTSVATAVEQHYWPIQAGGELPQTDVGICVALADRIDTLVGIFGIGMQPSGSKDPFGLRRASLSILRILIEKSVFLDLDHLINFVAQGFQENQIDHQHVTACLQYVIDRLRTYYEDDGISVQVFRSVASIGIFCPHDIDLRVRAVNRFSSSPVAPDLASANKRVANILAKLDDDTSFTEVDKNLLSDKFEVRLFESLSRTQQAYGEFLSKRNYAAALEEISKLYVPLEEFFDNVMVNSDDAALRLNRLNLLKSIHDQFMKVGNISELAGQ